MHHMFRMTALTLASTVAVFGLTGFTTISVGPNTGKIDWQYQRTAKFAENSGTESTVTLNYGYAASGVPNEVQGTFTLKGATAVGPDGKNLPGAGAMPGLNSLLRTTRANVADGIDVIGSYTNAQKAADLEALKAVVPNTFAASVAKALPEGRNILDNPVFKPASDANSNLIMKKEQTSKVWASFVAEGAGFQNSIGYFIYNPECTPASRADVRAFTSNETITRKINGVDVTCKPGINTTAEIVILPNASQDSPLPRAGNAGLGTSSTGPTVYLGDVPAGMAMGFVVIANAWNGTGTLTNQPGVNKSQSTNWIYYSLSDLNPEPAGIQKVGTRTYDDLKKHVILLKDGSLENFTSGYHRLALGFEDYDRKSTSCDHDFNDLVMVLHVEKKESVSNIKVAADTSVTSTEVVKSLTDTSTTTTYSNYPSATTWATLAYEDLWPAAPDGFIWTVPNSQLADYDFNDLVVKYRSKHTIVNDKITQLDLTYRLDARGGELHNGFAVQFRGLTPAQVASIQVVDPAGVAKSIKLSTAPGDYVPAAPALHAYVGATKTGDAALIAKAIDSGSNQLTLRLFNDAFDWLGNPAGYAKTSDCYKFYNTSRACPVEASKTFTVQIKLSGDGISKTQLTPPYNPYIFNTSSPSKEVHLPNQSPTQLGKSNNSFGTAQDATNKTDWSKTYVTSDGRPWALHIPYEWDHPQESNRIGDVFDDFATWVQSKGTSKTTWYTNAAVAKTFRGTRKFPK